MSSIYDIGTSYTSQIYSSQNSKYRGGVIGWKHKEEIMNDSSSTSGMSEASSDYVSSIKSFAVDVNDALDLLTGKDGTAVFDSITGTSSNAKEVSVKITDEEKAKAFNADGGSKAVEVRQLAAAQKNSGTLLTSADDNNLDAGNNFFEIEKGGETFQFNINVNESDSNRTVQEKMAAAINRQKTGIEATVVYNERDKTSSLVLKNKETGTGERFDIRDVGNGNIVSEMGVGNITTQAEDAIYTLDGNLYSSAKNEVDLGDGLTATFNKVTEEEVDITASKDTEEITNAIYDLVNGYNQLREAAMDFADSGAKDLQERLDSITSAYGATLKRVGVSFNGDGYLQIDKEKLTASIENGQAEGVFGESSGFTRSLSTVTEQVESDPKRYLSFDARTGRDQEKAVSADDFDDLLSTTSFTPYQSMQLNNWDNMSMLLNAFV